MGTRAWLKAADLRRRLRPPQSPSWQQLVERYAPGKSFVDIGCMWNVHGAIAFHAEEVGASSVTGSDLVAPTPQFLEEVERRGSKVRFVQGDINEETTIQGIGVQDVVYSSGVLYHVPSPIEMLQRLRSITGETLILGTASLPEVPGIPQACVFWPGLSASDRAPYDDPAKKAVRHGISNAFDGSRDRGYGNWWWGITPSALRSMLMVAGFDKIEITEQYYDGSFITWAVAHPGTARFV